MKVAKHTRCTEYAEIFFHFVQYVKIKTNTREDWWIFPRSLTSIQTYVRKIIWWIVSQSYIVHSRGFVRDSRISINFYIIGCSLWGKSDINLSILFQSFAENFLIHDGYEKICWNYFCVYFDIKRWIFGALADNKRLAEGENAATTSQPHLIDVICEQLQY
jgi:hypothetical protein